MQILKEFREFAFKGNVMDLAIGVVIGAAFGKIVSMLVANIIMPPIGLLLGGMDFSSFAIKLKDAAKPGMEPVMLKYGIFLNTLIDFLIIAAVLFLVIKAINKMKRAKPEAPPEPTKTEELLTEIRDLLKQKQE